MADQAKISIGVDGASNATRAAQDVETAWSRSARTISSAWGSVGRAIGGAMAGALQDIGRVALAADSISFAGAVKDTINLTMALERMSVAGGRGVDNLRSTFDAIGKRIGEQPEKVAAWQRSVNRTVYDFDKATKAVDLLSRAGFMAGRSFEELGDLPQALARSSDNADQLAQSLGAVQAQMALLGKDKGASLLDSAGKAGGMAGKFAPGAIKSKGGLVGETTAIQTELIRGGMDPVLAGQTAEKLVSDVAANPREFELMLGMKWGSLTDKYGRVNKSPLELLRAQQKAVKKMAGGNKQYARFIAGNVLGPMAGGAATDLDFDRVGELANLSGPGDSGSPVDLTPTVKRENDLKSNQREAVEPLMDLIDGVRGFAAENPVTSFLGSSLLSGAAGFGVKALLAGGSGAASAGTAAGAGMLAAGEGVAAVDAGAALLAAAEGGWLSSTAVPGALAMGATGAGIGLAAFGGMAGQGALLASIGVDRDTMGAEYRNERPGLYGESQVRAILSAAGQSDGDPAAFLKALSPQTRADIAGNPSLQAIAQSGVTGEPLNVATLSAAIAQALKSVDLKQTITVVNQTDAPIDAVNGEKEKQPVKN